MSQLCAGRGGFPHQSCPGSACSPLLQGSIAALLRLPEWGAWGEGVEGEVLQLYLGAPECYSSAGLEESFPVKAVQFSFGPVCSDSREVVIAKMSHCNESHSRFIGKENPGGGGEVAASCEKQQQTEQGPEFI